MRIVVENHTGTFPFLPDGALWMGCVTGDFIRPDYLLRSTTQHNRIVNNDRRNDDNSSFDFTKVCSVDFRSNGFSGRDVATVEIDTTLPWARAQEEPNNALVPIATQVLRESFLSQLFLASSRPERTHRRGPNPRGRPVS